MATHPIVLAHGITRIDILREVLARKLNTPEDQRDDRFHYFKGIKSHLESSGFTVFHSNVAFADNLEVRAAQLSERVNEILRGPGLEKVHIIAHSMGGLDARHMIVDIEGMADKVASLTTIGTPHLGTGLADFVLNHGGTDLIEALSKFIPLGGFKDLTVERCGEFNNRAEAREAANKVIYRTYASSQPVGDVFGPFQPSWVFIKATDGDNDGLVPVSSQRWKTELTGDGDVRKTITQIDFPVPADHFNEIGWWDPEESNLVLNLLRPGNQIEEFERRIRDVYLEIATDVSRL